MGDDTKQRLINAAGEAFAEKGFEAASIREICARAQANIAAVNYHFGDKRALYVAAVSHAQCCRVADVPFPELPAELPATDRLRSFVRVMLERMLETQRPRWHLEIMLRELARPTEACATVVEDYVRPMATVLKGILLDLLPPDFPEDRRWMIGHSIVGQVLFYYINRPIIELLMGPDAYERLTLDQLADHIAAFSLAALGQGPPLMAGRADAAVRWPPVPEAEWLSRTASAGGAVS